MFKNYLLITLRTLKSNKLFSLINILGLAVGLASVILIGLFVRHELNYDRHWEKADRTFKVMRTFKPTNGSLCHYNNIIINRLCEEYHGLPHRQTHTILFGLR